MSHVKLDLKQFKHVRSDKDSTTLQHEKGHELRLAHRSLSKEARAQLEGLSKLAKSATDDPDEKKMLADGGEVDEFGYPKSKKAREDAPQIIDKYRGMKKGFEEGSTPKPSPTPEPRQHYAYGDGVVRTPVEDESIPQEAQAASQDLNPASSTSQEPSTWDSIKAALPIHLKEDAATIGDALNKAGLWAKDKAEQSGLLNPQLQPLTQKETLSQTPSVQPGTMVNIPEAQNPAPMPETANQAPPQDMGNTTQAPEAAPQAPAQQLPASQPQQAPAQQQLPQQLTYPEYVKHFTSKIGEEDAAWANDLNNGHIEPKTYRQMMYDGKSTLGKIGTIFGLMLGGAGAGLAGGENPLLEMMKQQIKNDLDAQNKSKDNAQNFLRLSQQHEYNESAIKLQQKQGFLTDAQAKQLKVEADIKGYDLANMKMNQAALHDQVLNVQKLPQGSPERAKAESVLAMMSQGIQSENYRLADKAASREALMQFGYSGNGAPNQDAEEQFKQQNQMFRMSGAESIAKDRESKHIPGVPGLASREIPEAVRTEIQAMNVMDNKGKDVLDFIAKHSGTWNPQTRAIAAQKIEEMKNFYNASIKGGALTEGRLGWYDEQFAKHPTDILSQLMGSTAKLKEMIDSNAMRRDAEIKNLGFQSTGKTKEKSSTLTPEGTVIFNKATGERQKMQGGKWVPIGK